MWQCHQLYKANFPTDAPEERIVLNNNLHSIDSCGFDGFEITLFNMFFNTFSIYI